MKNKIFKSFFYIIIILILIGVSFTAFVYLVNHKSFDFDNPIDIKISEPIFRDDPTVPFIDWETYSVTKEEARLLLIYLDEVKFIKNPGTICESYPISYQVEMNIDDKLVRFSEGCNYFLAEIYNSDNKKEDTVYADVDSWQFDAIVESIIKKVK